jgi:hypothetical protein
MNRTQLFFAASLVFGLLLSRAATGLAADPPADLKPIFNGMDLTGWKVPEPNPFWTAADGVLVGENNEAKKGSMLYTEKSDYLNLIVEADVRWSGDVDTGIMIRKPELQMQLGTSRSLKRDMSGCFYIGKYPEEGRAKNTERLMKADDWNTWRLQAVDGTFTVWLNGQQVTEYQDAKHAGAGPIGLQIHPGVKMKAEFRNVKVKTLE